MTGCTTKARRPTRLAGEFRGLEVPTGIEDSKTHVLRLRFSYLNTAQIHSIPNEVATTKHANKYTYSIMRQLITAYCKLTRASTTVQNYTPQEDFTKPLNANC